MDYEDEMDYDTLEYKEKSDDNGGVQLGVGIALSVVGAAGIVVGFYF